MEENVSDKWYAHFKISLKNDKLMKNIISSKLYGYKKFD